MSDEEYSPEMERFVAGVLRKASPKDFENLRKYYQQRSGPGLELAEAEAQYRQLSTQSTSQR
ncbi:hypothetical protein [Hymenobacter cellulosivorans]|uniref:Uncharacterized protein n=1 Tax=Hymenobacter cellulosivorans TaxID=2932249 RepID=A0ABY4F8S8_9BACT|nr:hypothetical protein [Hymenobacter cellulosivorans]UOQ53077.1 hypothetical protein MUN80_25485 [Hymenobacter cellulosivorans]